MIKVKAEVTGLKRVQNKLKRAGQGYRDALSAALYQKGLQILAESVKETPVKYGFLRQSGYVSPPQHAGNMPIVEVGFGKEYAPYVHNRRELHHNVGKSHFLIDPVNRHRNGYKTWIAKKAQQNYERGIGIRAVNRSAPTRPPKEKK